MTAHGRGEQLSDRVSRGKALLRASNYMRTAEFSREPGDSRRMECASRSRTWFDAGLATLGVDATRSRTPYEGAEMETIFLRSPHPGARDVLVVHGGFDSTPEELYFVIGAGAIVLIDYFPGMLRAFAMPRLLRGRIGAMPAWLQLLIRLNARYDAELRWALGNALWTFGVATLPDLIAEIGRYDDGQWASTIKGAGR
ncbi:hypothetical protein ACFOY2_41020 [Nonomuraea purpurea]|uniref:Uncharacterized protein n=1 Tax=Nonomuraea purpurea TaxID=1849276 RepID=A0ABV8GIB9_9ACTN